MKQLLNLIKSRPDFYKASPTCQVPDIGKKWEAIFGQMTHGFFVEVGAYDGESYSNTSCLADVGWSGLYIEPVTEFADRCALRHQKNSRVQVVNCAASDEVENVRIFLGDVFTTVVDAQVADYEKVSWASGLHKGEIREVPAAPLDVILDRNNVAPRFDLLVIDVEGAEEKVMRGFTLDRWLPKAILIELEDEHPDFCENSRIVQSVTRVRALIENAGYRLYFKDHINSLYVLKACDG
jgi:FkbM family methyltransferase